MDQVNYQVLDQAKNSFIEASRKTLSFPGKFGVPLDITLGASANLFELDLSVIAKNGKAYVTLIPEGLGTADDAKPEDLTDQEAISFWRNIAFKTLATLTNDAATAGVQTILVSLYLPSSTPESVFNDNFLTGFLNGFVDACKIVGCAYISGETPELRTKIYPGKLDIAGALFGVVPSEIKQITGKDLNSGDYIVMVESSGPHENGFTPLRALAEKLPDGYRTKLGSGQEYWQACNAPSKLYTPFVQDILRHEVKVSNLENITGHGWQKIMRSKKTLQYNIEKTLPIPEIFTFYEDKQGINRKDMISIFNAGTGFCVFTKDLKSAESVVTIADNHGLKACVSGEVRESESREVVIKSWDVVLNDKEFTLRK